MSNIYEPGLHFHDVNYSVNGSLLVERPFKFNQSSRVNN
jgi:hypothetical protein